MGYGLFYRKSSLKGLKKSYKSNTCASRFYSFYCIKLKCVDVTLWRLCLCKYITCVVCSHPTPLLLLTKAFPLITKVNRRSYIIYISLYCVMELGHLVEISGHTNLFPAFYPTNLILGRTLKNYILEEW